MEGPYTRALAEYISRSSIEKLPENVVEHAKLLILDTIGVGVYGVSLPWSERLRATAEATEAAGRASVWCTPLAFSAPTAAMINATAIHAFELDDVGAGGHNGSVTSASASRRYSGAGVTDNRHVRARAFQNARRHTEENTC